jgi:hypothetical protein
VRAFVSTAVAVAVALHAVLGCCWHHVHAAEAVVGVEADHVEAVAHGCCHHCRHDDVAEHADESHALSDDADRHDSEPHAPGPCTEKCDDVAVGRAQTNDAKVRAAADFLPALDQPVLHPARTVSRFESADAAVDPPPLRLHLLLQLLLI